MIIVSQDKTRIVNFDNAGNINIEKCYNESLKHEDFTYDILVYIISRGIVRLGKNKTESRAKVILQEIIKSMIGKIDITNSNEGITSTTVNTLYYEMPED